MKIRRAAPQVREASPAYRLRPATAPRVCLLDVNVLIALCDGRHEHHHEAGVVQLCDQ